MRAQVHLRGTVLGENGEGVSFAVVKVGELGVVATTDEHGAFEIAHVPHGELHLRIACVGYVALDTLISVIDGGTALSLHMQRQEQVLHEVEVSALRAGDRSPYARDLVTREQLERTNTGVDMPLLLEQLPSVVTTTDAGTGFGYSGIRIRGSDATRINVTVNGVPINDAESQAVYWVDMPDVASSSEDIEVQRGVGSSTNGSGAFGASINVRTTAVNKEANASVSAFGGSYGTQRYTASLGSGLLKGRFCFDGRISSIASNGYVDRATADLKSHFLQGAWVGKRSALRFITFGGHEITYQAWNGVPAEVIDTNRTWNDFTYANQVDDYTQTHYQALFDHRLGEHADFNITLFRVTGRGFYEQLNTDVLSDGFGLGPVVINNDTLVSNDVITRKWLDNAMNGANAAIHIRRGSDRLTVGGSISEYSGQHYGEVIWARFAGSSDIRQRFYDNTARKTDANMFAKLTYALTKKVDLFGDAQVRSVMHRFFGFNDALSAADQTVRYTFFNPKVGAQWRMRSNTKLYASVAVGNREPNRDDLEFTTPQSRPRPERMVDYELGGQVRTGRFNAGVNVYHMDYRDQLVLTGKLNDVGAALRTNVASSFRQGIELQGRVMITKRSTLAVTTTISRSKVRDFIDHADDYDNGGQRATALGETDIAFSPNVIAGGAANYRLWDHASHGHADITWITRYVGKQFLDNTSSDERSLDAYFVNDLRANVSLTGVKGTKSIDFNLTVRNVFSELYESNGWSYSYWSGGERVSGVGYYPQAPINVLGGVTVRF
jgi:iron complex outermembrane recepter protein